jgi:hypothetical protein
MLRLMEELFVDAMRSQWSRWFKSEPSDVEDMCVPVISINRSSEHVATMIVDGDWPESEQEVSCSLARALLDSEGFTLVWKLATLRAPDPAEEAPPEESPPEPKKSKRRALEELRSKIDALELLLQDSDSEA